MENKENDLNKDDLGLGLVICGGWDSKVGAGALGELVSKLPVNKDENLIVGFDSADDAAVYKINDEVAMIQTLDFFPSMVNDPYLFGKIAATNSLSDVWAMGGKVTTAMNILAVPEHLDLKTVGEILRGGAEKVLESGGVLVGGHSIHDNTVKYGLSVSGLVHPDRIWENNKVKENDVLILSKPLGVGIVTMAYSVGETDFPSFKAAINSMTTLNKYSAEIMMKYNVSAATDITGFGFLGHLGEMMAEKFTAEIYADKVPTLPDAKRCANEFIISAGGQKNRNFLTAKVRFEVEDFGLEEIMFDPQTSGGLLYSLPEDEANRAMEELSKLELKPQIVGRVIKRQDVDAIIK